MDAKEKEKEQHRDDSPKSTTKRRKHLYKRVPSRSMDRVVVSLLPKEENLVLLGEARVPKGSSLNTLARDMSAQIADMDVTLDVLVEPIEDPEVPAIRFYVEREATLKTPSEVLQTQFHISSLLLAGGAQWHRDSSKR
jgi:hypothetical protein